jgi:hypothetical protein
MKKMKRGWRKLCGGHRRENLAAAELAKAV